MAQVLAPSRPTATTPIKLLLRVAEPENDRALLSDDEVKPLKRVRKKPKPSRDPAKPKPRSKVKKAPTTAPPVFDPDIEREAEAAKQRELLDRLSWRVDAPSRPVDWRWQRASWLVESGKELSRCRDDMPTGYAFRFCRHLSKCRDDCDFERLHYAAPDFFDAWTVWQRGEKDGTRANLEARILAKQAFLEIGRKLCLTEAACRAYEEVFFNVTDRLHLTDFIINRVIGSKMHFGLAPEDTNVIWKMYAYFGGVHVLEDLIYQDAGGGPCSHPENVASYYGADAMAVLRRKMAIAMRTLPLDDPKIALRFLRLGARMQQVESRSRKSAMPSVSIGRDHVDAMMQQIRAANDGLDPGLPENFRAQYHAYMAQFKQQPVQEQQTGGTPAIEDDADWPFCGARDTE